MRITLIGAKECLIGAKETLSGTKNKKIAVGIKPQGDLSSNYFFIGVFFFLESIAFMMIG